MKIWKKNSTVAQMNELCSQSLVNHLGIEITEIGDDYLKGTMPVDLRTKQPFGILHGGASVALAETLGSIAGNLAIDDKSMCVGLEINANHLTKATSGLVTGEARPLHIGQSTQVWEIKISNEANKLVCVSRFTVAIITQPS